jgi:type I restriction-modification system DNA methylase subunit
VDSSGQLTLDLEDAWPTALPSETAEHGEVFTQPWVVDLILDLAGYDASKDLASMVAVEPACGTGAFLGPMVSRLSASCRRHGRSLDEAPGAIRAQDLLSHNVEVSRRLTEEILIQDGWSARQAATAADAWVHKGDYLLDACQIDGVDFVLGNPPYIRLESRPVAWRPTGRPIQRCPGGPTSTSASTRRGCAH